MSELAPQRVAGEGVGAPAPEPTPEPTPEPGRERTRRSWGRFALRGLLLVAALLAVGFGISRGVEAAGGPEAIRDRFGLLAPLVSAVIHGPLAASPFPSELFALSHGALYGFWLGALAGWGGWVLGSAIEYAVLLRWRTPVAGEAMRKSLPRWLTRFPVEHPVFLIGARQLPGGYHLVNVVAPLAGVPFRRYLWCSLISQIPTALFISAVGVGLLRL